MDPGDTTTAPSSGRADAPIKVFLLGRFEVVRGSSPIAPDSWRRRRPADLLKLAALTPGRALSREEAIETLWPDKEPGNGANNLHRALYDLRQILGGRYVDLEHGVVHMQPDVWVDVDAFEAAAQSDALVARQSALALYRGDLAPEDRASPWLAERRAHLRELLAEAALPVARAAAERGDAPVAVPLLRRVLEVDPTREEPNLLLIRLLAEAGRRADALRQYDACEAALRARELGPPSAELRQLRDAVQRGGVSPAHGRAGYDGYRRAARRLLGTFDPPPLRGRTSSLLLFESLVEQGAGSLILLGERGVGKSRLALEGARIAQESGAVVLTGLFDPTRAVPYGCFADLFADYRRAGGPGRDPFADRSGGASPEAGQTRLLAAVKERLAEIGGGRPLYLLLDDLHRADESSTNLFHFLARSAGALRLMLVGTAREDAVHSGTPVQMLLAHLDCERLARGVRVQRLDLAASRQQLADILGTTPSEPLAAHFYRLTDGSPFYTEELARAFKESGHVKVAEDPVAAVRERVARLGTRAVSLLETAAVAGRRFDFDIVKAASGLTAHEALTALDQMLEARIVDEDGSGHHFHHSLVREAIHTALSPARKVALHRAIAAAVEARAAAAPGGIEEAAEELAYHRRAGDQPERAFGHLVAAGHRAAARTGLREASGFFEGALALADAAGASGPSRLELLEALGGVQLALAELNGAVRTFEAAATLADASGWRPGPEQRARAHRGAALALLVAGRRAEAGTQLDSGLGDALLGAGGERAELLHLAAQLAWHEGRFAEAREAARRCAEEANRAGDAGLAARARDMESLAETALGEAGAPEVVEPSLIGSEQPFEVHLALWENDLLGDRPAAEIERGVAAFRERATARGAPVALALAHALEGTLAARAGRLDSAEGPLRDAQQRFRSAGSALGEAFAIDRLAALLTARGQLDEALALLGEGVLVGERASLRRHALTRLHATLAWNRLAAGAVYAAEDAVHEASELAARHGECAVCHALFRPELIRVEIMRGRLAEAEVEAIELEALAARRGGAGLGATARLSRGRVLAAQALHAEAAAAFQEAASGFGSVGARIEAARALALAARALRAGVPERLAEAEALAGRAAEVLGPSFPAEA